MSLRHTLLAILDWEPLHGYALREYAKGYAWLHPLTNANIYPTLRALEEAGFVVHREEVHEGRLRKVYEATRDGHRELRRWLEDDSEQRGIYRDPALLKICLLRETALEGAQRWVAQERDRAAEAAQQAREALEALGPETPKYTRLVFEHGAALTRLRLEWLEELRGEVERDLESLAAQPASKAG